MKTVIRDVTIINQQGSETYRVGRSYNGLLLDRIEDKSIQFPDSVHVIYVGLTADDDLVFKSIYAPVVVEYAAVEK